MVRIGSTGNVEFRIDLIFHDADSGTCLSVMDTMYKITDTPTSEDVAQIVAYAVAMGALTGVLIYPRRLSHPFRAEVGGTSVHAVSFPIDGDVEAGGRGFVEEIAAVLPCAPVTHSSGRSKDKELSPPLLAENRVVTVFNHSRYTHSAMVRTARSLRAAPARIERHW